MNYSLSTVESSQSGFIRQSFLDNELEHGLRKVENLTKDLTDEVNHALRRISDIMSVPTIRDDEFIYKVRQAMKHKENTIERLQQFDQRQTYTLHTIDQDFTKLKNCVHDIQAMFKSKQIKITTFKMNQLSDIEPYRDIRARLEYEEAVHLIKEKLIDLYHKAIDTNYAELLLDAFHEVFPGFSSKAKVSSTIERNDLSHLPKDVADRYKDSPELTEEQIKGLEDFINGKPKKSKGDTEEYIPNKPHTSSESENYVNDEHNIFGRPLGGGKPEIDEKLVAGSEFVFDFFIGDDVNTVLDSEASLQERILAGISIVPAGKVLKLADKIKDLDKVADVGKDVKNGTKGTDKIPKVKSAKEVEIINQRGESLGELDEIDIENKIFYEDKSAQGLNKVNPKTGLPAQTPQQFADKQILTKTRNRINAFEKATSTRATKNGSSEIPSLEDIKNIKEFVFRLDGDTAELRQAVTNSLNQLRKEFPDYKFSAKFGGN